MMSELLKLSFDKDIKNKSSHKACANLIKSAYKSSDCKVYDYKIYRDKYEIPTKIYFPDDNFSLSDSINESDLPILLFLHGGGWTDKLTDVYNRLCIRMANATSHIVVFAEYRLAPEYKFPIGLEDCYSVAKSIFTNDFAFDVNPNQITLIGDSSGGNLTAALSLMARDRGEFLPKRQILIYPATNNDYSTNSPFNSIKKNMTDFLLSAKQMNHYMELYQSCDADRKNPYFAPLIAKDLSNQPKTLILTAQYDPLCDEGEAYGEKLKAAGNYAEIHRIKGAFHGFFTMDTKYPKVRECYNFINKFLNE